MFKCEINLMMIKLTFFCIISAFFGCPSSLYIFQFLDKLFTSHSCCVIHCVKLSNECIYHTLSSFSGFCNGWCVAEFSMFNSRIEIEHSRELQLQFQTVSNKIITVYFLSKCRWCLIRWRESSFLVLTSKWYVYQCFLFSRHHEDRRPV